MSGRKKRPWPGPIALTLCQGGAAKIRGKRRTDRRKVGHQNKTWSNPAHDRCKLLLPASGKKLPVRVFYLRRTHKFFRADKAKRVGMAVREGRGRLESGANLQSAGIGASKGEEKKDPGGGRGGRSEEKEEERSRGKGGLASSRRAREGGRLEANDIAPSW
ncbi:hypothetical protein KM043_013587 [Ampulex compressa]|nr:hypothetical protein KM043_013587 [Ampulex compressa]